MPRLQTLVVEQAELLFPECRVEVPFFVALPAGIHPYNRNSGYFDHAANALVLYQEHGRHVLRSLDQPHVLGLTIDFIRHELCHWYQFRHLGYKRTSTLNVHRHRTWSRACWVASTRLWPEADLKEWQFRPYTSKRGDDGKPRRCTRDGALTDTELHHWPSQMQRLLSLNSQLPRMNETLIITPYERGWLAGFRKEAKANPFTADTDDHGAYDGGFDDGAFTRSEQAAIPDGSGNRG